MKVLVELGGWEGSVSIVLSPTVKQLDKFSVGTSTSMLSDV